MYACIFTANEYLLYHFFKKSYYVHNATDNASLCRLICHLFKANSLCMNYIENKKKVVVSSRFFHFPQNTGYDSNFVVEGGGGEVSMPQVSIDQTREIYTSFIFFFRWLFLISITPVTHTAKSPCSTVYLFHFVPVIHVTFVFNFFFNFIFQCSIQRLSTFKDRFMYIVYIDSAKRICAIIQSGQVFILWIYISLKTVERHVKSSRK